jgi:putative transposase
MPEIERLSGRSDWIDVGFVERERTSEPIIKVGIQLHITVLSILNTK